MMKSDDVEFYRRNGFVRPGVTLPTDELSHLVSVTEKIISEANGENLIRQVHIRKRAGLDVDEGNPWGAEMFRQCVSPTILDCVEQILGPDIILFTALLFAKPAGTGREVPWHQDGFYSPPRPLDDSLTVWIAIDRAGPDNGCLRFIPGSHRLGLVPHFKEGRDNLMTNHNIEKDYIDVTTAVDDVLSPGQFSMHGEYTMHGSNPNTSGARRVGFAPRYMSAKAYYDRGAGHREGTAERPASPADQFPIWVVRGENRNPRNDLRHNHEGLEELDEIASEACLEARRRGA